MDGILPTTRRRFENTEKHREDEEWCADTTDDEHKEGIPLEESVKMKSDFSYQTFKNDAVAAYNEVASLFSWGK